METVFQFPPAIQIEYPTEHLGIMPWNDIVAKAEQRIAGGAPGCGELSINYQQYRGESWHGTPSLRAACDLMRYGWPEGTRAVSKAIDHLPIDATNLPDWQLGEAGAFPCIPAFVTGEPECIWQQTESTRPERRILLAVSYTVNAFITASQALNYAKAVAAIVRAIEASGANPAVYAVDVTKTRIEKRFTHGVIVRDWGQPLDLSKVAFAFHPSFQRRIIFAYHEVTPHSVAVSLGANGYGAGMPLTTELVATMLNQPGVPIALLPDVHKLARARLLDSDASLPAAINIMRQTVEEVMRGTPS